jgi:hypothetical protein
MSVQRSGEVGLRHKPWLVVALLFAGISAFAQETASNRVLSPAVQDIVKMAQAGVDESVMLTYVRTSPTPFGISADDVLSLKMAGVPQSVITEILRRDAEPKDPTVFSGGIVTEDQLFRLHFGYLFYQGKVYSYQSGLSPNIQKVLQTDPAVQADIRSFSRLQSTSHVLTWTGLGLVLGGSVYGMVAASQDWGNVDLNAGIALGAIGTGIISAMISAITNHAAYLSLYNGLEQYNQDLIAQSSRR